jgi:hypothetical protein
MIYGCVLGHHFGRRLAFLTPAAAGIELSGTLQKLIRPAFLPPGGIE